MDGLPKASVVAQWRVVGVRVSGIIPRCSGFGNDTRRIAAPVLINCVRCNGISNKNASRLLVCPNRLYFALPKSNALTRLQRLRRLQGD